MLGWLGNSGNSTAPHLHFHVMDSPSVLGLEGLPYVIDRFKYAGNIPEAALEKGPGASFSRYVLPTSQFRTRQFPLDLDIIDFWQ